MTRKPRCFLHRVKGQLRTWSTGKTKFVTTDVNVKPTFQYDRRKKFDVLLDLEYEATMIIRREPFIQLQGVTSQNTGFPITCCLRSMLVALKQFITGYTTIDSIRHNVWPAA